MRTNRSALVAALIALLGLSIAALAVVGANEVRADVEFRPKDDREVLTQHRHEDRPDANGMRCASIRTSSPSWAVAVRTFDASDRCNWMQGCHDRSNCGRTEGVCTSDTPRNNETCRDLSVLFPQHCPAPQSEPEPPNPTPPAPPPAPGNGGGNLRSTPPSSGWSAPPPRPTRSRWSQPVRRSPGIRWTTTGAGIRGTHR